MWFSARSFWWLSFRCSFHRLMVLLIKVIPLFDWLAQRPKCFKIYITKNPELFQDTPKLAKDFDSPICLICTMAKIFNDYYYYKIVSHQFNVSEDSYLFLSLGIRWQAMSFWHQWYDLKGGLDSEDTHYFGLGSHIFRSFSSTIDSPRGPFDGYPSDAPSTD